MHLTQILLMLCAFLEYSHVILCVSEVDTASSKVSLYANAWIPHLIWFSTNMLWRMNSDIYYGKKTNPQQQLFFIHFGLFFQVTSDLFPGCIHIFWLFFFCPFLTLFRLFTLFLPLLGHFYLLTIFQVYLNFLAIFLLTWAFFFYHF